MEKLLAKYNNDATEIFYEWNSPETEAQEWLTINSLQSDSVGRKSRMQKSLSKRAVLSSFNTFNSTNFLSNTKELSINYNLHKPDKLTFLNQWFMNENSSLKSHYNIYKDLKYNNIHDNLSGKNQEFKQNIDILFSDLI